LNRGILYLVFRVPDEKMLHFFGVKLLESCGTALMTMGLMCQVVKLLSCESHCGALFKTVILC